MSGWKLGLVISFTMVVGLSRIGWAVSLYMPETPFAQPSLEPSLTIVFDQPSVFTMSLTGTDAGTPPLADAERPGTGNEVFPSSSVPAVQRLPGNTVPEPGTLALVGLGLLVLVGLKRWWGR